MLHAIIFFVGLFTLFPIKCPAQTDNQTDTLSPILPSDSLPFQISIQIADFSLPLGVHSGIVAEYKDYILLMAGRTNGLHGFNAPQENFPPSQQNTTVLVVNIATGKVYTKSLWDPSSGLTQAQVDLLSVTSPQDLQRGSTLYMTGGYGVDSSTGNFSTKDCLTAINIPGLIHWVISPSPGETAAQYIRQTFHPIVQVTGGAMYQANPHSPVLLIFGQNFQGYYSDNSNGDYTQQVRCFNIIDNGRSLYVQPLKSTTQNPNYRRRDLNVVPIVQKVKNTLKLSYVALSGVFTLNTGVWTVPVSISANGDPFMPNQFDPATFKQGMNNYVSAFLGLYSQRTNEMYTVLMGGISYGYFENGFFATDPEIPFINELTTIKIDPAGKYTQYLMDNQYPQIQVPGTNPPAYYLFGSAANFFPNRNLPLYPNGVFQFDKLSSSITPVFLGYIIGGIQSKVANTNFITDSFASTYIFEVYLNPTP